MINAQGRGVTVSIDRGKRWATPRRGRRGLWRPRRRWRAERAQGHEEEGGADWAGRVGQAGWAGGGGREGEGRVGRMLLGRNEELKNFFFFRNDF
jgi:hypothetical protein